MEMQNQQEIYLKQICIEEKILKILEELVDLLIYSKDNKRLSLKEELNDIDSKSAVNIKGKEKKE